MSTRKPTPSRRGAFLVVEFDAHWLKVMQCRTDARGLVVSDLHLERFADVGSAMADSMAALFRQRRFKKLPVIGCIPRSMATVRMLDLPSTEHSEIADMVDLQIGKQTPYAKEEILTDFRVVGPAHDGYTRVMLVIVQQSVLRQRFYILEELGVDVQRMTLSSEGLRQWCRYAKPGPAPVCVLDLDSESADLSVVRGGGMVFTRTIQAGAEQLVRDPGATEQLVEDVRAGLEGIHAELPGVRIAGLCLTGAAARLKHVAEALRAGLDVPVECLPETTVARVMPKGYSPDALGSSAVSLAAVLGAAVGAGDLRFSFVPETVEMRRQLGMRARTMVGFAVLFLAVLFCLSTYGVAKVALRASYLGRLDQELSLLAPKRDRLEQKLEVIREVRERQRPGNDLVRLLTQLPDLVPGDLYFDEMVLNTDERRLVLNGHAGQRELVVDALIQKLEQSPRLQNVRLDGTTVRDPKTGRYRFSVVADLEG